MADSTTIVGQIYDVRLDAAGSQTITEELRVTQIAVARNDAAAAGGIGGVSGIVTIDAAGTVGGTTTRIFNATVEPSDYFIIMRDLTGKGIPMSNIQMADAGEECHIFIWVV